MFTLCFDCLLNVVMHAFCVKSRVGRGCGFVIRRSRPNFSRGGRKISRGGQKISRDGRKISRSMVEKLVALVEKLVATVEKLVAA